MSLITSALGLLLTTTLAAVEPAPGIHTKLHTDGLTSPGYDLFLPKAFADQPTGRFPLVILASRHGGMDLHGFTAWAEREDVVLVSLAFPANDRPDRIRLLVSQLLTSVTEAYRIEPALRFCFEPRGQVNDYLAQERADPTWGGIVMCASSPRLAPMGTSVCIGFIPGPSDDETHARNVAADIICMKAWRLPLFVTSIPETSENWSPTSEAVHLLDAMVQFQRIAHPALPPAAIKAGQDRLRRRITGLAKLATPAERVEEANVLLRIEPVSKGSDAPAIKAAWCSASLRLAQAEADPLRRNQALEVIASDERAKAILPADRRTLQKALAELRKDAQSWDRVDTNAYFPARVQSPAGSFRAPCRRAG